MVLNIFIKISIILNWPTTIGKLGNFQNVKQYFPLIYLEQPTKWSKLTAHGDS